MIQKQHINWMLHILIWSALLLLPYLIGSASDQYRIGVLPGLAFSAFGIIHLLVFYTNAFFLVPRLLNRRRWWLYIPAALLLLVLSLILKFTLLKTGYPGLLQDPAVYRFIVAPSIGIIALSILYRKVVDRIRFEKQQKEREAEMLLTELKFLRSQISPHFLFNVMTNLVSLARKRSEQLEPALITLSEFMRYMVYDTQGKRVSLSKETEHLKSYLSLQKLRFGSELRILDAIEATDADYHIEPMLLIPFAENAFKHGAVQGEEARITINLRVASGLLHFEVINGIPEHTNGAAHESSGVGLSNVTARLELLYPQKHELRITRNEKEFHIYLKLEL